MIVWGSIFNSLLIANDMLDDMAKMSLFSVQKNNFDTKETLGKVRYVIKSIRSRNMSRRLKCN